MNNPKTKGAAPTGPIVLRDTAGALERRLPALLRIPASELARINTDVRSAAKAVLAAIPRIKPYAEEIKRLYQTEEDLVGALTDSALATLHANIMATADPQDELQELGGEAYVLRAELTQWARPLASRGLLSSSIVDKVGVKRGYDEVVDDLTRLVEAFEANWDEVEGNVPLEKAEIDRAKEIAERILTRVVARQADLTDTGPGPMEIRRRAFTDMKDRYRQVSHAIAFIVGPDGNAVPIAPPLSPSHLYPTRRTRVTEDATPQVAAPEVVDPMTETDAPEAEVPMIETPAPTEDATTTEPPPAPASQPAPVADDTACVAAPRGQRCKRPCRTRTAVMFSEPVRPRGEAIARSDHARSYPLRLEEAGEIPRKRLRGNAEPPRRATFGPDRDLTHCCAAVAERQPSFDSS